MTTVRIDYFGIEGSGKNVTEAKKDAGRKIEKALEGSYTPRLLTHRGHAILVYREPHGWCSATIADPDSSGATVVREGPVSSGSCHPEADVLKWALEHLAQLGWQAADGVQPPEFLKDRVSRSSFKTWAEFQLRYQEAIRRGMGSNDAHSYAGRNPQRAELWQEEDKKAVSAA